MKGLHNYFLKWRLPWIFFAVGIVCGVAVGVISPIGDLVLKKQEKRLGQGPYGFINPLLDCEGSEELISWELKVFQDRVEELIEEEKGKGRVANAAVYFKDLNDGPWFGINEDKKFFPGSLLKVPIMMAYLKEAEVDPEIMSRKIRYDKELPEYDQYIKSVITLSHGNTYTVSDLINMMIVYSDNNAAYLLRRYDQGRVYDRVYHDLGLTPPADTAMGYEISLKAYSSFFRVLYNASYLGKEMSNMALTILNSSDFRKGLVAGVTPGVSVAHKFGEKMDDDGVRHFHDCGVVYYPGYPYLLCVMTKGDDYGELISVIRDISSLAYEEVKGQVEGERR